jgi:hypothetical protein
MLRGNRLLISALGLIAILTAVIGYWTWPSQPELVFYGEENLRNGNYNPGGRDCEAATLASIVDRRERSAKTDACSKEAEEYRLNTNDLIQQTRAADAAQAQANIASQQLWTGWLQTLGGVLTLVAAAGAAIYARDAAKHTMDGNRIAKTDQRPWLSASLNITEAAEFPENGLHFEIDVWIENVGHTPARNVVVRPKVFNALRRLDGQPEWFVEECYREALADDTSGFVLVPGEKSKRQFGVSLHKDQFGSVGPTGTHILPMIVISIVYRATTDAAFLGQTAKGFLVARMGDSSGKPSAIRVEDGSVIPNLLQIEDANIIGVAR